MLFADRWDDALAADHRVRLLDEILARSGIYGRSCEAKYHERLGQPAIHPRVPAGVVLQAFLSRIRSRRALEEALQVRIDFRWPTAFNLNRLISLPGSRDGPLFSRLPQPM